MIITYSLHHCRADTQHRPPGIMAEYTYSAWREILSAIGPMADINPLRYRGYYYDSETGFYYLQSRYYDPSLHRFINADAYASTGQSFIGTNMFAYCNNNPVTQKDASGNIPNHCVLCLSVPTPVRTNWHFTQQRKSGS